MPAILPQDLFDAAQARKEHNVQYARRNRKHAYLLAGRIRCGICGRRMAGSNSAGYLGYRCNRNAFQDGSTLHTKRSVQACAIEPVVWQAVLRVLQEPTVIAREVEQRQAHNRAGQDAIDRERLAYQRQLAQCEKELRKWEDAYLQDALSVQDLKTKKAEIAVRRASAEHELTRLDAQEEALEQITIEMGALTDYCKRVHARLQTFKVGEQTQALKALDIHVIWHPEKPPEITGAIPVEIPDTAHVFAYHASRCTFE